MKLGCALVSFLAMRDWEYTSRVSRLLAPNPFRLLMLMRDFAQGRGGCCWVGRSKLAEELGWSDPGKVSRARRPLVDLGLIEEVSPGCWLIRSSESFPTRGVETNAPPRNNPDIKMKRLAKKYPVIAGQLVRATARVAELGEESASAGQTSVIRKVIESFVKANPASQETLESTEWWDGLIKASDWAAPTDGRGKLGYGKRMAWVFDNTLKSAIPTKSAEELQEEAVKASDLAKATGHNPFAG